jgi:hypothetical protein
VAIHQKMALGRPDRMQAGGAMSSPALSCGTALWRKPVCS